MTLQLGVVHKIQNSLTKIGWQYILQLSIEADDKHYKSFGIVRYVGVCFWNECCIVVAFGVALIDACFLDSIAVNTFV